VKTIDPKNLEDIRNELLVDYKDTLADFSENHQEQLSQFASVMVDCHRVFQLFTNIEEPTARQAEVRAFAYSALDNIYTSMKLLMLGYIAPSGNMLRQSLESTCMTVLLATDRKIEIGVKRGKSKKIDFWRDYSKEQKHTMSFRSISHVRTNSKILEVDDRAILTFVKQKEFYNNYSHPSRMSIGSRLSAEGRSWLIGGDYDVGKKSIYNHEADTRINYAKTLPTFLHVVLDRATA